MTLVVAERFAGFKVTPLTARRLHNFRSNTRGFWSTCAFLAMFFVTLPAEFVANDRPLVVKYAGDLYFPVIADYPETAFGGDFETATDYRDPYVIDLISKNGWMIWPLIPFSYNTIVTDLPGAAPSPPTWLNWLGTDDQARDVVARIIYGVRISVLFG